MTKRLLTFMAVVALSACGGSSQTASGGSPSPEAPTPSPSPSAISITNLDPCQLVTQQEASQLAGASYGAGTESTISSASKMCVYGARTLNVFTVEVAVAADAATAQATWAQEEAQAKAGLQKLVAESGASVALSAGEITLPGADKAATATGSGKIQGQTISVSAIYVLKGAVFFTFADLTLGKSAPTLSDMAAQATIVLTRV